MENITVIIPIHIYNDEVKKYLNKAINSVFIQTEPVDELMIVGPQEVIDGIKSDFKQENLRFLINTSKTDYCHQINFGVTNCKTKYFSILGFDDEYNETWFKNVNAYVKHMPDFSIFLPIVNFMDSDNNVIGKINEIIWAMSFSNEIGVIDADILQKYYDFSVCGGVFRTDDFIEAGMLKPSIELAFWYEFLLRAANESLKIYVIPRNGYYHLIDREDSILNQLNKKMDGAERAWWIKQATKEYYYKQERKESYKYVPEKKLVEIDGLK